MTFLEVVRIMREDDYEPLEGLHLTYQTVMFQKFAQIDAVWQDPGYIVHLRDGDTVVATVEGMGSPRAARDTADDISMDTSRDWPWLDTLRTLARARRVEHVADTFVKDLIRLGYWRDGMDPDTEGVRTPYWYTDEEREDDERARDVARSAKRLLTKYVPAELRERMPLGEATEEHIKRLRSRAAGFRSDAVRLMPDPATTPRPHYWIVDHTHAGARKVWETLDSHQPYRAHLPHSLLRCWGELPEAERQALGPDRRDALLMWAIDWGLPKAHASEASGVARTTIDRTIRKHKTATSGHRTSED